MSKKHFFLASILIFWFMVSFGDTFAWSSEKKQLPPHPWLSYEQVDNIDELAAELRQKTATAPKHSFSRDWFLWDIALTGYQDHGRRDEQLLKIIAAYFRGAIFDRYYALEAKGEGELFHLFYGPASRAADAKIKHDIHGGGGHGGWGSAARMRIYEELVKQGLLSTEEQDLFKKIVIQSLSERFIKIDNLERGANNRPIANNGGVAIALRLWPDMPRAKELNMWLDRLWREFAEPGDTPESNYYPYGPLFLNGMLDIAKNTGRLETDRELIYAVTKRYMNYFHGSGLRGNPNSSVNSIGEMSLVYDNPWSFGYYDSSDSFFWYRIAKEFKSPEFLWAAVQAVLGGFPPDGKVPDQWQSAYNDRFYLFNKMGIKPSCPEAKSSIGVLSPLKHKLPERLYLHPGRQSGKPFVSYFIYDRTNEYMHNFSDAAGRLYEYCVDGAKLLHSSGKYNGIFTGQAAYDMLLVLNPKEEFPVWNDTKKMGAKAGVWNTASCCLTHITNNRQAPDSRNWFFDKTIQKFRRTDDSVAYSHGNMDGYWKLNDEYFLESVGIVLHGNPDKQATEPEKVIIQNLRLSGPKGETVLVNFDSIPSNLKVSYWDKVEYESVFMDDNKHKESIEKDIEILNGEKLSEVVEIVDGKDGGKAFCVLVKPGKKIRLTFTGLSRKYDLDKEYTRISFDYKAISDDPTMRRSKGWRYGQTSEPALVGDIILNERTKVPSHQRRGGILIAESLKAENKGNDSFGRFSYRNYFGPASTWTRQSVLTEEGYLIVHDEYLPGKDVDGYQAGPVWLLRADGKWITKPDLTTDKGHKRTGKFENIPVDHTTGQNWFDGPAWDHAWWQKQARRVLVYIHPENDRAYGQIQTSSSADISRAINNNLSYAKANVKAGKPEIFLSVLIPFNEGEDAAVLAKKIRTSVDAGGNAKVRIGRVYVTVSNNGNWRVKRK